MTRFQRWECDGILQCKLEVLGKPIYYTWDDYDYYNYCESGLWVEHMKALKEMNE